MACYSNRIRIRNRIRIQRKKNLKLKRRNIDDAREHELMLIHSMFEWVFGWWRARSCVCAFCMHTYTSVCVDVFKCIISSRQTKAKVIRRLSLIRFQCSSAKREESINENRLLFVWNVKLPTLFSCSFCLILNHVHTTKLKATPYSKQIIWKVFSLQQKDKKNE